MPDITKCLNQGCVSANYCARFTCTPKPKNQSYAFFRGKGDDWYKCEHYIGNEKAAVFDILADAHVPNKFNSLMDFQAIGRVLRKKPYKLIKIVDFPPESLYAIQTGKIIAKKEQKC